MGDYNTEQAQRVPQVLGVYNRLSDSIAQAPIKVYRKDKDNVSIPMALPKVLRKPNPNQTMFEFKEQLVQSLLYTGNAFIFKLYAAGKPKVGLPDEMYVVHPDDVRVEALDRFGTRKFILDDVTYSSDEILHIRMYVPPGEFMGVSPVERAQVLVRSSIASQNYTKDLYENGLNLAGVIESQDKDITSDEARSVVENFVASHRAGAEGGSPIGFLTNASWKTVTLSLRDAQYIESEKWSAQVWATVLGVPAFMVDASAGSWAGTGLEVMNLAYLQYTLQPLAERIEEAFSTFVLPGNQEMKFNLDSVLRSTTRDRYQAYDIAIRAGWMTRNEVRELEDKKKITSLKGLEGLDIPVIPTYMSDADTQRDKQEAEIDKTEQETENLGDSPPEESFNERL
ncbi:MAG: phage portal protein [Chitinophagaceae bacterium]